MGHGHIEQNHLPSEYKRKNDPNFKGDDSLDIEFITLGSVLFSSSLA